MGLGNYGTSVHITQVTGGMRKIGLLGDAPWRDFYRPFLHSVDPMEHIHQRREINIIDGILHRMP